MIINVIYEDKDVVCVNKPSGVMTHPDGRNTEETVSDWFAINYPESALVGETQRLPDGTELLRPGIVHRLDTETSGVLLLTKTQESHAHFKQAFQDHEAKKTYLAFVYGVLKENKGSITFPIGRSNKDFRLRSAQPGARGTLRDASTAWEVIADIGTHSLLRVTPKTGRTHQIRVHMKAIHHPIVCDRLYAPNHPCDLGFSRLGLHAYNLQVPTIGGEVLSLTASVPDDLRQALERFPGTEEFLAQK